MSKIVSGTKNLGFHRLGPRNVTAQKSRENKRNHQESDDCYLLALLCAPSITHYLRRCYLTHACSGSPGTRTDTGTRKCQRPLECCPPQRALTFIR